MKKATKTLSPLAQAKASINAKTAAVVVATLRELTPAEKKDVLAKHPEAKEHLSTLKASTHHAHLAFRNSKEAEALLGAVQILAKQIQEEHTLLRAEEIKEERSNAKKGK